MNKKKIILIGLAVVFLGTATYSVLHKHEDFDFCQFCGKEGWLSLLGGFTLAMAIKSD
jgi:hypothetical protein